MKILDEKFLKNKLRYVLQCSLATFCVFIVLLILDTISDAVIVASIGASSFIAFAMPKTRSAHPKSMIGGYIVGLLSGSLFHHIYLSFSNIASIIPNNLLLSFLSALAIGLTIFIMAITNTEHPPSAGIALGIALSGFDAITIIVIIAGITVLALLKCLLMPLLKNLF